MSSAPRSTALEPAKRVISAPSRVRGQTVAMRESTLREPVTREETRSAAAIAVDTGAGARDPRADSVHESSERRREASWDGQDEPSSGETAEPSETGETSDPATRLERRIRAHLPRCTLAVTLTDNRYTMISVRREGTTGARHYAVRLHHMFADAGPAITQALARYVDKNDRDASRVLGDFIDANQGHVRTSKRRPPRIRITTRGRWHDLCDIYDDLNERYFGGRIEARITWGQRTGKPRRRNSIKMGSYSVEDRVIRIHRSLDREFVPRFFVEWIVYHEMLHQVHDIKVVGGRRCFHSKAFLADEAKFEHYRAARIWERAHLEQLLTY